MPMRKLFRLMSLTACAIAALLALGVSPALAHNTFIESVPAEGDVLESPPSTWMLTFEKSVPLDSASGAVINGDGVRTALSTPRHGDSDKTIIFDLPQNLSGVINARWRLVGVDGHVISGRVSFTVQSLVSGESIPITATTGMAPVEATFDSEPTTVSEPIRVALRLANFVFLLLLGGVLFAELFVAERSMMIRSGMTLLRVGAWGSAVVPLAQWWAFAIDLGSFSEAFSLTPGVMFLLRSVGGFLILAACEMTLRGHTRINSIRWQLGVAWIVYAVALAYGGHSRSQGHAWLGIPADVLHTSAVSAWLGGLAALVLVVLPSVDTDQGVACLKRFSHLAERAVIVVAVTGVIQTIRLHASMSTLFTSTHGMLLLLKLASVAIIIRLAARNRKILRGIHEGGLTSNAHTKSVLVRSALKEMMIAAAVLVVTALLVGASLD